MECYTILHVMLIGLGFMAAFGVFLGFVLLYLEVMQWISENIHPLLAVGIPIILIWLAVSGIVYIELAEDGKICDRQPKTEEVSQ